MKMLMEGMKNQIFVYKSQKRGNVDKRKHFVSCLDGNP